MDKAMVLYCDNSAAVASTKDPKHHKRSKHIDRKYHIIRGFVESGNVMVCKITSEDNLADLFTKTLVAKRVKEHVKGMWMRNMSHLLA